MTTPDTQKGATTPTPLTDAVAVRGQSTSFPRASYFVDADHARTLERQLAQSEERVKEMERLLGEARPALDDNYCLAWAPTLAAQIDALLSHQK